MKYPQSFIEEIRNRIRISELIGRTIPIKRAGREYHALCPFHKEKTPSFTINDEKAFYHCFGCGAHGDAIGFVKEYEHLNYREAIEKLAGMAGLAIPQLTREQVERDSREQSLQDVMKVVTGWFEEQLYDTQEGELARRYLVERGFSSETVARFRIGYAPGDRDALTAAMKLRGISEKQLIETGMLIQIEERTPYSRFRRRLMFPIRDRNSRVIAFGGRVLPGEPNSDAPKYLNSPETPLFSKGRQLYNLDLARRPAFDSGQLIIAEGYMDVVALAQAGFAAVAPLGTAVTAEQLQISWQLVDEPILCLDGDSAGQRAMSRAVELALPMLVPGKTLKVALLPKGEDPDSLVKTPEGIEEFKAILEHSEALASFLYKQAVNEVAYTPEAKAKRDQKLYAKISQIKDKAVRHYYKQFIWERFDEQKRAQRESLWQKSRDKWHPEKRAQHPTEWMQALISTEEIPYISIPKGPNAVFKEPATKLIALVMACPTLLNDSMAEEAWLTAQMPELWQQQIHSCLTELHIQFPESSETAILKTLKEEISEKAFIQMEKALQHFCLDLRTDEVTRSTVAMRLWPLAVNDYSLARVRIELHAAQIEMAECLNEDSFSYFQALKEQEQACEKEKVRFYLEEPLSAASG